MSLFALNKQTPDNFRALIQARNSTPYRWANSFTCIKDGRKELRVRIITSSSIQKSTLSQFVRYILKVKEGRNYESLRKFSFDLNGCNAVHENDVKEALQKIGKGLKYLRDLNLNFQRTPISAEGANKLASVLISNAKVTQHLALALNKCPSPAIHQPILTLSKFQALQSLFLDFSGCRMVDDYFINIFSRMLSPYFRKIKSFSIKLSNCPITDQSIQAFSLKIGTYLKNVIHLSLNFSECTRLTDNALKVLSASVEMKLKLCQSLTFNFAGCNSISSKGIEEFALRAVRSFEKLDLNFSSCHRIADESVSLLFYQLKLKIETLQNLSLNFSECLLTDNIIIELAVLIGSNNSILKHLYLNFSNSPQITDSSVKELFSSIGLRLKNLKELNLNFAGCSKVTDNSLNELSSQITAREYSLKNMFLNFKLCPRISNSSIGLLAYGIKNKLLNLKSLGLSFDMSEDTSKRLCEFLKESPLIIH